MVFSFFKKPSEKMVAKPAVSPHVNSGSESGGSSADSQPLTSRELPEDDSAYLNLADFVFSRSSPDFQVDEEANPIDSEAQEAAVFFANGQDDAARILLENAVHNHPFGPGERLWLMLFDLYWLTGNKPAFEALEVEYVQSFEKSPPAWRGQLAKPARETQNTVASLLFRGDLTGDNRAAFDPVVQSLAKNIALRLDLSGVARLDADGCGRLLALMQQARKHQCALQLLGCDALSTLLKERMVASKAEDRACWLLFLELCQLDGAYELFEEMAIQFAVTFEVSPPSWEAGRVRASVPDAVEARVVKDEVAVADGYVLRGEIKVLRFADLVAFAELRETVQIDCSELKRIDFTSAGALLNSLMKVCRGGKTVIMHYPNRMVAELFSVVGLTAFVRIIFNKQ